MAVEILVGNIASGKSTYAKERARQGAVVVSHDALVNGFHGGLYTAYDAALRPTLYWPIYKASIIAAIRTRRDVVVDDRNHTEEKRGRIIEMAKANSVSVACTVFDREVPQQHAERRFETDSRGVDLDRWTQVAAVTDVEWEEPNALEGFVSITRMQMRTIDDVTMNTAKTPYLEILRKRGTGEYVVEAEREKHPHGIPFEVHQGQEDFVLGDDGNVEKA